MRSSVYSLVRQPGENVRALLPCASGVDLDEKQIAGLEAAREVRDHQRAEARRWHRAARTAPRGRHVPAGAYVDSSTWDQIIAKGIDPELALERRDAGTALAAVGALVVTGPTG